MDATTAEAIDNLRVDIRLVDVRVEETRTSLRAEMQAIRDELRAEIAQSRVHAQLLSESIRDDIRIVAEAVASLSAKVDGIGRR